MTTNKIFSGIIFILLLLLMTGAVFADNEYDPAELLEIVDEQLMKRIGPAQDFSESQGYVNEIFENNVIHQRYIYDGKGTDALLSLFPVSEEIMSSSKYLNVTGTGLKKFHVSLTVHQAESVPEDSGGACWIRCSDILMTGKGRENGLLIVPGNKAFRINAGEVAELIDLSALTPEESIVFDLIRLDGVIYVYADQEYLFSFADDIPTSVLVDAGSLLFASGNRIRCDFDDFKLNY